MHGLLLATFVEFARERDAAALDGEPGYGTDVEYPDEAFNALVERVATATRIDRADVLRAFGRHTALTTFPRLFPDYYASHDGVRPFLLGVEDQIHEVVRATLAFARARRGSA